MLKRIMANHSIDVASYLCAFCAVAFPLAAFGQSSTEYRYDALGRLVSTADGDFGSSSYQYDAAGNRVQVTTSTIFTRYWSATSPEIGHIVGRAQADGWAAIVEDPVGHLSYGPYVTSVPAGARVAAFKMMVDVNSGDNSPVVEIDVWDATTGTQLAFRQLTRLQWSMAGRYQIFELPFQLDAGRVGHALEFRVFYLRTSYVRIAGLGYR